MAILNYFKKNKLTEDLHIDGATFLGNAYGFDVYRILTWDAAEQFVPQEAVEYEGEQFNTAGRIFIRSRATFEGNINDTIRFYLFALEGTNRVTWGVLSLNQDCQVTLQDKGFSFLIHGYVLQSSNVVEGDEVNVRGNLPLFLLPDIQYNGHDGVIIKDNVVLGSYNGLIDPANVPEQVSLEGITKIKSNAFTGFCVPNVIVEASVKQIEANAFNGYTGTIKCASEDPTDNSQYAQPNIYTKNWATNWNGDCNNIVWGIYVTAQERERRRIDRELQDADPVTILRYKKEGNGITILGIKRWRREFDIPAEIEGKPVTKIAPFAFYDNTDITRVNIPNSVKEIGKAAFSGCVNAVITYPRTATVYTDAFENCRRTILQ